MFHNKNDLKIPLRNTLFTIAPLLILTIFIKEININNISKSLCSLNTTFGTTFAAFSVTALSLLPLLQTKKWFELFKRSNDYKSLIENYKAIIKINMIIIFIGILGYFLIDIKNNIIDYIYSLLSLVLIAFTCFFIIANIKSLIDLLNPDEK